jgi:rare lipoprotein A
MKESAMAVLRYFPAVIALAVLTTGCGTPPTGTTSGGEHRSLIPLPWKHRPAANHAALDPDLPALPAAGSGRGGYYQDDGPGTNPPPNLRLVPDAEVRAEPYAKFANRPYAVFGTTYTPLLNDEPFTQRGVASWYGVKFHGQRTSSGEAYDMYKMTAAHPTLPIPSYARVTNVANGKSVVVRINDRGPFHSTRIIDVSYTAALKLGLLANGSTQLEVEHIPPAEIERMIAARGAAPATVAPQAMPKAAPMLASSSGDEARPVLLGGGAEAGFYLQLGSYAREDGADGLRRRLEASDAGLKLDVEQAGKFYRLFAGPYASREDAQAAGKTLSANFKLKPIVIER